MKHLLTILLLSSCSTSQVKPSKVYDLTDALFVRDNLIETVQKDSEGLSVEVKKDCDGMIWQGQWCAVNGCSIDSYEDSSRNGKFYRRPEPRCWVEENKDQRQDASSDWSRDQFSCGLGIYGLVAKDLNMFERHIQYGQDNLFVMGEPTLSKGYDPRVVYTPNVRAYLYHASYSLGGKKHSGYNWPSTYPKGKTDYHAHLQLCSIFARGLSDGKINNQMAARIQEHYKRDKTDLWAALLWGKYSGDYDRIYGLCSNPKLVVPSYVRCDKTKTDCKKMHKAFICQQMIEDLKN